MTLVLEQASIKVKWLGDTPGSGGGVTWGLPWKRGELARDEQLHLCSASGEPQCMQSWPTAYWPDGSVKWTAHAASFSESPKAVYHLAKKETNDGTQSVGHSALVWSESAEEIHIDTGAIHAIVPKKGTSLIRAVYRDGELTCSEGKLVCLREERKLTSGGRQIQEEEFESSLERVSIEQHGPVRLVILAEGRHRAQAGEREWLPFRVRMVFYQNQAAICFTHSFLFDGDAQVDFIKGIGITFKLPLTGPLYNRHVRLAGDTGFFGESPKNLATGRTTGGYEDLYKQQQAGEYIELIKPQDANFISLLEESALWDSFKLVQDSPDYYVISKRTEDGCSWLKAVSGQRARGLAYVGDQRGGLAVGIRNFWQKHPGSIEIHGAAQEQSELKVWFWSPDTAAMDLRHYDTKTHVNSAYEGAEELRSTPYGIGNTNELILWCCEQTPKAEELEAMINHVQSPPLLVCEPERYHETKALGIWSLPDRSTSVKAIIEDQLDELLSFYQKEVEQRRWYGFWDFGDFMHSYDTVRHTWRYDMGGYAWQNSELVPNMWLWTMFLRSGREDIFRMAEAMTRHTSEVDVYHLGEYAGLGSRHNVVHWGCGCKEARIAMAGLHKYYYYLTADERIGDILDEVADADYATLATDPMRDYFSKDDYPTHARSGPDWSAFVSNWLYQWERYDRTAYRDKIVQGIQNLKAAPFRLLSGTTFGYDPASGELHHISDDNYDYHMVVCFGAPQVWFELAGLLSDPEWVEMLVEFGAFYHLDDETKVELTSGKITGKKFHWPMFGTSMSGYAAANKQDGDLARKTWDFLLNPMAARTVSIPIQSESVPVAEFVRPIQEIDWLSTNVASQWSLNTILSLEQISEWLPEKL